MKAPSLDVKQAWLGGEIKHPRQLYRAQFSPDARFIAAVGQDKLVHVWELEGEKHHTLSGHKTWSMALTFHPKTTFCAKTNFRRKMHLLPKILIIP